LCFGISPYDILYPLPRTGTVFFQDVNTAIIGDIGLPFYYYSQASRFPIKGFVPVKREPAINVRLPPEYDHHLLVIIFFIARIFS
jgi:hypothetical protein